MMATGIDERKIDECLRKNGFQECMENLQKFAINKPSEKGLVDRLKQKLVEAIKDPKTIFAVIEIFITLLGVLPLSIIFSIVSGLWILFEFLSKKSSKIKVIEQQTYIDHDIQRKAFAVQSALSSSLRYLQRIHKRKLNDHEIDIVQSQIPRDTGTEFLGVLEENIKELQKGKREKKSKRTAREKSKENAEKKEEESEEDTLQRCNAIIALIDLYCVLSCLREFVMYYFATLLVNNRVPDNITESYLERREHFKNNREAILKVLYEPEAKNASVAAVFIPSYWPKLRHQLESRPDLGDLIDRPLNIISASDERFAMFRYDPDISNLFTRTKYVRVMAKIETIFKFRSEGDREFKIHLCEHDDCTWKMSGDRGALLETSRTTREEQDDKFNIVRISNGNVMFSSKKRPTCFIRMENAKDDARLGVANNSFDEQCQWELLG